jgi:2-alkyl-3-oxoalkanoate reductase
LAATALRRNPDLSGRVYFISQDDPIYLWEMVNRILAAGGKPPLTRAISPQKAYFMGMTLEFVYRFLRIGEEPPMTRFLARELSTAHWFNISAAKTDFGYAPKISTDEGLRRLKQWLEGLYAQSA